MAIGIDNLKSYREVNVTLSRHTALPAGAGVIAHLVKTRLSASTRAIPFTKIQVCREQAPLTSLSSSPRETPKTLLNFSLAFLSSLLSPGVPPLST